MNRPMIALLHALAWCVGATLLVSCGPGTGARQEVVGLAPGEGFSARRTKIEAELVDTGDHEWAGIYNTSGGLTGETLHLAPDGQFVLQVWGCTASFDYPGKAMSEEVDVARLLGEPSAR